MSTASLDLLIMGIVLVLLGLFLWFALAFVGSVGGTFFDYTFFASSLFMFIAGSISIACSNVKLFQVFCSFALLLYVPMIWQRFSFDFGVDFPGMIFDIFIVAFLIFCITHNNS